MKKLPQISGPVFRHVQGKRIFIDSMTFVDSRCKVNPAIIEERFLKEKDSSTFDLQTFINTHFDIPLGAQLTPERKKKTYSTMEEYIKNLWPVLTRDTTSHDEWSTTIALPYPYIVPGGRFRCIYYWDSYFTMLGMVHHGLTDMVYNMCRNFAYLIETIGHIPNGNREYLATRSQVPFFVFMVELLAEHKGKDIIEEFIPALEKEYIYWQKKERTLQLKKGFSATRYYDYANTPRPCAYWEDTELAHGLSPEKKKQMYGDLRAGAESGWDYVSRWFGDYQSLATIRTTDILPVDLNSLLYYLENFLMRWFRNKDSHKYSHYRFASGQRRKMIRYLMWSEAHQYFFDVSFTSQKRTKCWSLAGVFPLFTGIATPRQAKGVAKALHNKFLVAGGLLSTLHPTDQQWDYANGWAPLHYVAVRGLQRYGYHDLAGLIRDRWIQTVDEAFKNHGGMYEKYNVVEPGQPGSGGEYVVQEGFGWTNGVTLDFLRKG